MTNLRHDCSLHGCYREQLWDWTPLNDCFSGKIRVGDIDGMVERNGNFLMLDGKRPNPKDGGCYISDGQRSMYEAFAKMGGTVIGFHGQPPATVQKVRVWRPGGGLEYHEAMDLEGMKELAAQWFRSANGGGA